MAIDLIGVEERQGNAKGQAFLRLQETGNVKKATYAHFLPFGLSLLLRNEPLRGNIPSMLFRYRCTDDGK